MTRLLEQAFAEAAQLPSDEQDALATWLMEELKSNRRWSELLASSEDMLEHLADEALTEHRTGQTRPLDIERE